MHWNHRVVDFSDENDGDPWVEVCEVFYDKNHEPYLYTARGVGVMGEDIKEVKQSLFRMCKVCQVLFLNRANEP